MPSVPASRAAGTVPMNDTHRRTGRLYAVRQTGARKAVLRGKVAILFRYIGLGEIAAFDARRTLRWVPRLACPAVPETRLDKPTVAPIISGETGHEDAAKVDGGFRRQVHFALGATAGLSSSAGNTVGQANRGTHYFR